MISLGGRSGGVGHSLDDLQHFIHKLQATPQRTRIKIDHLRSPGIMVYQLISYKVHEECSLAIREV